MLSEAQIETLIEVVSRFHGRPYRLLLWNHGLDMPENERRDLARALLTTDCRYVVCGGADCKIWHDTVDEEWIQMNLPDLDAALERHGVVMTTWHQDEPPEEVAFFFTHCTTLEEDSAPPSVLLHIGDGPAAKLLRDALAREGLNIPTDGAG